MRVEVPEFKRCCFCLPLRYGLLVWSYLLLVPLCFLLVNSILTVIRMTHYISFDWENILFFTISYLILLCTTAFNFLLIVAAHKKSLRLLKIYYMCGLISGAAMFIHAIANFVRVTVESYHYIKYILKPLLLFLTEQMIYIVMLLYIIVIVRSEILKLENNHSFKFFNHEAEAEITYYNPESVQNVDQHSEDNTKESR